MRKGPSFFDVRVFNPSASSYRNTAVASLCRQFEREKQRRYEQRVQEVDYSFGVFNLWRNGWCCYHHVQEIGIPTLSKERLVLWSVDVLAALLIKFSLLRSVITCLRGAKHVTTMQFASYNVIDCI